MEEEREILPLLYDDFIFKRLFTGQDTILEKMISDITGIEYSFLKGNMIFGNDTSKRNEQNLPCDFILTINKQMTINLEINKQSYLGTIVRNFPHLFQLFSSSFSTVEKPEENLVLLQINLNDLEYESSKYIKPLSKYFMKRDNKDWVIEKKGVIYDLIISECYKSYCNNNSSDIPNHIRWGSLFYSNNLEEISDILKEIMTEEERNLIMDRINNLTQKNFC